MSRDWEEQFRQWAKPPGKTEQDKCTNAENAIKKAIAQSQALARRNVRVFAQGSYANNTNVRQESDVDVAVVCSDTFYFDLPEGATRETYRIEPATYDYPEFKNDVEAALVAYFGRRSVVRGNKAFDIKENTYHVEADAAPFFEHHRYQKAGSPLVGVELRPDKGGRVINWPEQHYENGVSKNDATQKRFKAMVRVLKCLCIEMAEEGVVQARGIPGFLIECLVGNVPNDHFGHDSYRADVRATLAFLFNNTRTDQECSEWGEVNELKYLFRGSQKWTRQQAYAFIDAAWNYVGFED